MKENLNELRAFVTVAQAGSFTKAAQQVGVSQSALSHTIRGMESRLKVKLLQRTTRSVSTTEAGEQLYQKLLPLFEGIDSAIDALGETSGEVRGRLRINGTEHAFNVVLREKLTRFLQQYPMVSLELIGETRFADIVAERFDAGIRLGDDVQKDMIAVRVSPDMQMCAAASPGYLKIHGTPKTPFELTEHQCVNLALPAGGVLTWEFLDPLTGKTVKIRSHGRFSANSSPVLVSAAKAGLGVVWSPRDMVSAELESGSLTEVLTDWRISYPGYHLYYSDRRADSPLFAALVACLKE
ncbi:LysR family transcriptional regulator [Eikenella sp. S3360]|uniref:LysR family transcriptional regulator n=1 Tax=Eikenella glucosivorans TaxID=2766967 RepID=A0ABS0NAB8_9NEIS|nr:LysR family transcriptional regulator [Eikenella glucosivorans]MBH5329199.1 LysR family transcriptional regulator [Eikenella glucosivorans]